MILSILSVFIMAQSTGCAERSTLASLIFEGDDKHAMQTRRFAAVSMHREVLRQKLMGLMERATPLPTVCSNLALEYCTKWKKYGEVPTYKMPGSHQRQAVFLQYKGQECLLVEDENTAWKSGSVALNIWNVRTRYLCLQTPRQEGFLKNLCVTPDGTKIIFCADDCIVRVYDAHTFKEMHTLSFKLTGYGSTITLSPDSQLIAAEMIQPSVGIWKLATGEKVADMPLPYFFPRIALCFSQDSKALHGQSVSTSANPPLYWWQGDAEFTYWVRKCTWDLTTKKLVTETRSERTSMPEKPATLSPDGSIRVHGNKNGTIVMRDVTDGTTLAEISCAGKKDGAVSFSKDAGCIAVIHEDSGSALLIQKTYDVNEDSGALNPFVCTTGLPHLYEYHQRSTVPDLSRVLFTHWGSGKIKIRKIRSNSRS